MRFSWIISGDVDRDLRSRRTTRRSSFGSTVVGPGLGARMSPLARGRSVLSRSPQRLVSAGNRSGDCRVADRMRTSRSANGVFGRLDQVYCCTLHGCGGSTQAPKPVAAAAAAVELRVAASNAALVELLVRIVEVTTVGRE